MLVLVAVGVAVGIVNPSIRLRPDPPEWRRLRSVLRSLN
jgi:hypothetical protein